MSNQPVIKMIQVSQVNWQVVGPNGNIMKADITISSTIEAEEYIKNYISSFRNWTYEMKPIKRSVK